MAIISNINFFPEDSASFSTYLELCSKLEILCKALNLKSMNQNEVISRSKDKYLSLNKKDRKYILNHLSFYKELYSNILEKSLAQDSKKQLWIALRLLELVPPSDLMNVITDDDCVEIYDSEGIQCYRNFTFASKVSYSLPEILFAPWSNLYTRDPEITEYMYTEAGQALTTAKTYFKSGIKPHVVYEEQTENQQEFDISFGIVSPLFSKQGQSVAFLATSKLSHLRDRKKDI